MPISASHRLAMASLCVDAHGQAKHSKGTEGQGRTLYGPALRRDKYENPINYHRHHNNNLHRHSFGKICVVAQLSPVYETESLFTTSKLVPDIWIRWQK